MFFPSLVINYLYFNSQVGTFPGRARVIYISDATMIMVKGNVCSIVLGLVIPTQLFKSAIQYGVGWKIIIPCTVQESDEHEDCRVWRER